MITHRTPQAEARYRGAHVTRTQGTDMDMCEDRLAKAMKADAQDMRAVDAAQAHKRPPKLKGEILETLKDKRWRTLTDICRKMGRMDDSKRNSTNYALGTLRTQGKVISEVTKGMTMWRRV